MTITPNTLSKLTLASIVMLAATGAQAGLFTSPSVTTSGTGSYQVFAKTGSTLLPVANSSANLIAVLQNGTPVGNVQLLEGASGNATLHGTLNGSAIDLSTVSLADWTANSNALTKSYITGAEAASGISLSSSQFTQAVTYFVTHPQIYVAAGSPDIQSVNLVSGHVLVGIDGLINATPFLQGLLTAAGVSGITVPANSQASDIVKITYLGVTDYLYSFSATSTGYAATDGVSFTGRYGTSSTATFPANVPEPSVLALIFSGIAGLTFSRRKAKA